MTLFRLAEKLPRYVGIHTSDSLALLGADPSDEPPPFAPSAAGPSSPPVASAAELASSPPDPELLVEPPPEPLEPLEPPLELVEPPPPEEVPGPPSADDCALEEPHAQSTRQAMTQDADAADARSDVSAETGAR